MIESLRNWIINICTIVLFITAVEMILPDNSLKKYSKFVMGVILISVLIDPVIKIFDNNFDISVYSSRVANEIGSNSYKNDIKNSKKKNVDNTLKTFTVNLEKMVENKLKEKFPDENYKVDIETGFDSNENKFTIKSIKIGVKDGTVEKIKKIEIKANANKREEGSDEVSRNKVNELKKYLNCELKVSKDIITVYKI